MVEASGEVVPTPEAEMPFKVVLRYDGKVMTEWPVASQADGQEQIEAELLRHGSGALA